METKERIKQFAARIHSHALHNAVQAAKQGNADGQQRVAAAMVWVAFSCPDAIESVYDLEVLDREAIALGALPPSLRYLNTRILQMHDVWHLAAGYETTASHEIAISAFQLAQFGHNYSAMFLATITTISCTLQPAGFGILMQLIAEGWRHGRETPAMMDTHWETEWNSPIQAIRESHCIPVYQSAPPANLFESIDR